MAKRVMPAQKRGQSVQVVGTPSEFISALCRKLGIFRFALDLAAVESNAVANRFFTPEMDAFEQRHWRAPRGGWAFLNPEFDDIKPWAARCLYELRQSEAKIALLTPASIGSNWYRDHIHKQAGVRQLNLNGRIQFIGHDHGYPKDLMVTLFAPGQRWDTECWRWQ